jgi:hypothetical protein
MKEECKLGKRPRRILSGECFPQHRNAIVTDYRISDLLGWSFQSSRKVSSAIPVRREDESAKTQVYVRLS